MAKSESSLPTTTIQPAPTPEAAARATSVVPSGAPVQQFSGPTPTESIDTESRSMLSAAETDASRKTLLKGIFAEYYKRGINILKPEIVLTSEFIPIRKTFEPGDNTGLNVDFGEEEIGVTGVLKLLELHQVVQQSVNESSKTFMSETVNGVDPAEILDSIKSMYDDSVLGEDLSTTVANFLYRLKTAISSPLEARVPAPQTSSATTDPAEPSEESVTYFTFRDMLTSSDQNQTEMMQALAEVVIIEKIMFSVGSYFKDLVLLRKKIMELISIPNMTSGDSGVTSHLDSKLSSIFDAVNKFKSIATYDISSPGGTIVRTATPRYGSAGATAESSTADSYETVTPGTEKASTYLSGEDVAKFGLNTKSISSADSNLLVLYQLFYRIMSLLDPAYCTQGVLWPEYGPAGMSASPGSDIDLESLTERARISFAPDDSNIASARLTDFFKRIGLSSFWTGNLLKRHGTGTTSSGDYITYVYDHIYTSIPHCSRSDLKNNIKVFDPDGTLTHSTAAEMALITDTDVSVGDISTYSHDSDMSTSDADQAGSFGYLNYTQAGEEDNVADTKYNFLSSEYAPRTDGYTGGQTVDISNDVSGYTGLHSMNVGITNENPRSAMMKPGIEPYENMRITAGEFLSIVCFDLVLDLNRRASAGVSQIGARGSSTFISAGTTGLREYFRILLGSHGVPDRHLEAGSTDLRVGADHQDSVHQFYKIVNPNGYLAGSTTLEKGYADTGLLHDVIFGDYPVIEDTGSGGTGEVAMLPSEVSFIDTAYKHLPGNIGIISEAYVNDNFTQLDKYITNLSSLVGMFSEDILNYTSIGQTDEGSIATGLRGSSGTNTPAPSWHARAIMQALGDGMISQYKQTSSEWSDLSSFFESSVSGGSGELADELFDAIEEEEMLGILTDQDLLETYLSGGIRSLASEYKDFNVDIDVKRYLLPLLFLTAAGEDDSDASKNILCGLVGNIHYNHILQYRGQRDIKNTSRGDTPGHSDYSNREWFQYGAFDNLNKMLHYLGSHKFAGEPTENDEAYRWLGQYKDYVGNQGYTDEEKACFSPSLIKGKKGLLGPDSTAELFESVEREMPSFIKGRNQIHIAYTSMNDTFADAFMHQGLISDDGIDIHNEDPTSKGYGDIINEPVLKLKRRLAEKHPTYTSQRKIWDSNFSRLIGKFDGLFVDNGYGGENQYKNYYYVPFDETLAKTEGPYQTNDTSRDFATINAMAQVLGASLNVRLEGDHYGLRVSVLPHQMQAITDSLRGISKKTPVQLTSTTSDNDFMKESTFDNLIFADHTLQQHMSLEDGVSSDGYQLYSLTYDNCTSALSEIMKPVYDKENSIRVCMSAILKHVSNLNKAKEEIISITDSSKRSPLTNLGLNFADQVVSGDATATTGASLEDTKVQLLRYMTQASLPTYYKNLFELVCESESSPLYPPSEAISASQLRLMTIALTGLEGHGLAEDEKMGKKSIVNVGIPSNLVDYLQYQGFRDLGVHGDAPNIYDSPYICIQLYKKDTVGGKLLYYPKMFLFNTDLFIIENYKNPNYGSLYGLDPVAQIVDAAEISSFEDLYDKFEMCKVDYDASWNHVTKVSGDAGMLSKGDDLEYLNDMNEYITSTSDGLGLRSMAQKEMKINHMLDYYLKVYTKIATGIDTNEYVFPLDESSAINQNLGVGRIDPRLTERRVELRQRLLDQLILNYPSANVDPVLAAELFRMDKNIGKANIFTAYEKCKNLISPKCFSRVFTMLVNESDFAVYPYPLKWDGGGSTGTVGNTSLIDSLQGLYDPPPKFSLGTERQLSGISNVGKSQIVYSNIVSGALTGLAGNFTESLAWRDLTSETLAMLRHMDDVEGDGVTDVYEIFATVTLLKRK